MKPPYAIGSVPSLSGHAIAYRWRSLPRIRRHRASKSQGSSERVLPWQITTDQLIFASLSHTHYWYEVGMLKVPAVTTRRASLYVSGGDVNHNADRRIRNAWCSFRKYTLELYDRPSASLELKIRMLRAVVLEPMLYDCATWSPRACHYDTLRRAHHSFLTRCIGWRKHNRADLPISYLDKLIKTGSESIEATLDLVCRICGAHGGYDTAEVRDVRRIGGGRGLCGGPGKRVDGGVSWTTSKLSASTPTSGSLQPRTRGNGAERQNKRRDI